MLRLSNRGSRRKQKRHREQAVLLREELTEVLTEERAIMRKRRRWRLDRSTNTLES